ncbi:hypothetical protein AUK11_04410 [bacterium CG2_30_37_16]|nr:MAG: hypothetical protein AUK11_04410 [bacterium CG2_30_37_16]PIP31141.1 MAG: hypothetical protein COX25_00915 [bacterium (Candidatus Howlettbacteria) CG23_combo_of_CG06-09_8_20_14_all_37_9]PIX99799.1 MAG: hypothetical protein COZ22_01685 [bacterium (Candidatus Howlettbacteria) CG_4_10_14_3_um_filter_37_10]PJB05465.1 MAG: hypothetical protein CO123_04130 [bacterium (Candidatus Howlettbacteria) CG_4_9_14_3_um_filter_37_10]
MIPTKKQCEKIWQEYNIPAPIIKHMELVSEICVFLGERLEKRGDKIDLEALKSAALLHDLDKIMIGRNERNHGFLTADILERRGIRELSGMIKKHALANITDATNKPEAIEEKVLFHSDKIASDKVISLEDRSFSWIEKYPEAKKIILEKLPALAALEQEILAKTDLKFEDIINKFNK